MQKEGHSNNSQKSRCGIIISDQETPSTTEFLFAVKNYSIKKSQYVQVEDSEDGGRLIFGYISEITKPNRYFERAESVVDFEENINLNDHFPMNEWEHLIAHVKILGCFKNGRFERVFSPPSPGSEVKEADDEFLRVFLGFDEKGLALGKILNHETEMKFSLTRLLQKHLAILAMSGAGKSHLASVLIEELLLRKKEQGRIATIVVDIHGEYVGFENDPVFGSKTKIIDGNEICIPIKKIGSESIFEWLPHLSPPQKELLRSVLGELRKSSKETGGFSFKELLQKIDQSSIAKDEVKKVLLRSLSELKNYKFLSRKKENPRLLDDIKCGELTILDFSTIDSLRKKQILVSVLGRRLFALRKKNKIPPFVLLIEEAHNFAREKSSEADSISRSIIETIAREGRKFGSSIILVSQRPVNLSTTALSQCNTHIILRVTNPNDLDHIQQSSEGIDAHVSKIISGLRVGEALIVGEAVNYPIFLNVRNRLSQKRERGIPLEKQSVDFETELDKKKKNVESFI